MAEQNTGDQPQPGAEQRIAAERDQLREQLAEAQAQIKVLGVQTHAVQWLNQRGVGPDAQSHWLQAMAPTFPNLKFESTDEIAGLLDAQFGPLIPQATPQVAAGDGGAPPPPVAEPPKGGGQGQPAPQAPSIANPTPGGGQAFVQEDQKIKPGTPEYTELKRNPKQFEEAARQGKIAWTDTAGRFPVQSNTKLGP